MSSPSAGGKRPYITLRHPRPAAAIPPTPGGLLWSLPLAAAAATAASALAPAGGLPHPQAGVVPDSDDDERGDDVVPVQRSCWSELASAAEAACASSGAAGSPPRSDAACPRRRRAAAAAQEGPGPGGGSRFPGGGARPRPQWPGSSFSSDRGLTWLDDEPIIPDEPSDGFQMEEGEEEEGEEDVAPGLVPQAENDFAPAGRCQAAAGLGRPRAGLSRAASARQPFGGACALSFCADRDRTHSPRGSALVPHPLFDLELCQRCSDYYADEGSEGSEGGGAFDGADARPRRGPRMLRTAARSTRPGRRGSTWGAVLAPAAGPRNRPTCAPGHGGAPTNWTVTLDVARDFISDDYCRCCGQGGALYVCDGAASRCPHAMCRELNAAAAPHRIPDSQPNRRRRRPQQTCCVSICKVCIRQFWPQDRPTQGRWFCPLCRERSPLRRAGAGTRMRGVLLVNGAAIETEEDGGRSQENHGGSDLLLADMGQSSLASGKEDSDGGSDASYAATGPPPRNAARDGPPPLEASTPYGHPADLPALDTGLGAISRHPGRSGVLLLFEQVAGLLRSELDTIYAHLNLPLLRFDAFQVGFGPARRDRLYGTNIRGHTRETFPGRDAFRGGAGADDRNAASPDAVAARREADMRSLISWPADAPLPEWFTWRSLNCITTMSALTPGRRELARARAAVLKQLWRADDPYAQAEWLACCRLMRRHQLVPTPSGMDVRPLMIAEIERAMGFEEGHTAPLAPRRAAARAQASSGRARRVHALGNSFNCRAVAALLRPIASQLGARREREREGEGLRVLSLFDGIGGAASALLRAGLRIACYVAVEIDPRLHACTQGFLRRRSPATRFEPVEDVRSLVELAALRRLVARCGPFDLVVGGSPCNNLSRNNRLPASDPAGRAGLAGRDSVLFFALTKIYERVVAIQKDGANLETAAAGAADLQGGESQSESGLCDSGSEGELLGARTAAGRAATRRRLL